MLADERKEAVVGVVHVLHARRPCFVAWARHKRTRCRRASRSVATSVGDCGIALQRADGEPWRTIIKTAEPPTTALHHRSKSDRSATTAAAVASASSSTNAACCVHRHRRTMNWSTRKPSMGALSASASASLSLWVEESGFLYVISMDRAECVCVIVWLAGRDARDAETTSKCLTHTQHD